MHWSEHGLDWFQPLHHMRTNAWQLINCCCHRQQQCFPPKAGHVNSKQTHTHISASICCGGNSWSAHRLWHYWQYHSRWKQWDEDMDAKPATVPPNTMQHLAQQVVIGKLNCLVITRRRVKTSLVENKTTHTKKRSHFIYFNGNGRRRKKRTCGFSSRIEGEMWYECACDWTYIEHRFWRLNRFKQFRFQTRF